MSQSIVATLTSHGFFLNFRIPDIVHDTEMLIFRRTWFSGALADVVLLFTMSDAEAYRVDDRIDIDRPFDRAPGGRLEEMRGSANEVLTAVLGWPRP